MRAGALALLILAGTATAGPAGESSIPESLTGAPGDAVRGRQLVANRQVGMCLLCHGGPFPEERHQGDLAPDLRSAARLTSGEIRARLVDPARFNPDTIMPSYLRTEGLSRVAARHRGRSLLTPEQVEDIVAYLGTLR